MSELLHQFYPSVTVPQTLLISSCLSASARGMTPFRSPLPLLLRPWACPAGSFSSHLPLLQDHYLSGFCNLPFHVGCLIPSLHPSPRLHSLLENFVLLVSESLVLSAPPRGQRHITPTRRPPVIIPRDQQLIPGRWELADSEADVHWRSSLFTLSTAPIHLQQPCYLLLTFLSISRPGLSDA